MLGKGNIKRRTFQLAEYPVDPALDDVENVFFAYKRHFQVELSEFRLPVRPQVFITEALDDLVILFEPRDHEDLLEKLGRLGQGEKFSRIDPARHKVVSSPFRRTAREHRGLNLDEAQAR